MYLWNHQEDYYVNVCFITIATINNIQTRLQTNKQHYIYLLTCTLTSGWLNKGTKKGTTAESITICICSLPPSVKYDKAHTVSTKICKKCHLYDEKLHRDLKLQLLKSTVLAKQESPYSYPSISTLHKPHYFSTFFHS